MDDPHSRWPYGGARLPSLDLIDHRPPGLLDVGRLGISAWITERVNDAQIRILTSRQKLLAAKLELMQTELEARRHLAEAAIKAEEEEYDYRLRSLLREVSHPEGRHLLESEIDAEKLQLERHGIRRQRLLGAPPPPMNPPSPSLVPGADTAAALTAPLERHVTPEQMEQLAVRAVTRFGQLPPAEAEAGFAEWEQELRRRFPAYAAEEVVRRAGELRQLLR